MKLRSWKNHPCPAATAGRNRIGATLPCRRMPAPVPDHSSLLLPDKGFVVFLPELVNAPCCSATQHKRADGNQQKQRYTDDQARLLHKNGSSSGCACFSLRFDQSGNLDTIQ